MMYPAILAMLAATASAEPLAQSASQTLGVTAMVFRPVAISGPSIRADGTAVTILNTADVEVRAVGATVREPDPDTAIVTSDRAGPMVITIIY